MPEFPIFFVNPSQILSQSHKPIFLENLQHLNPDLSTQGSKVSTCKEGKKNHFNTENFFPLNQGGSSTQYRDPRATLKHRVENERLKKKHEGIISKGKTIYTQMKSNDNVRRRNSQQEQQKSKEHRMLEFENIGKST